MKVNHIYQGDALEVLQSLEAQKVDMCVTSPPYWGLRDYGVDGQLGLEPDFNEYIDKLCTIFDEVRRVLKDEGTCWVNLGDSYSSTRWSNSPSTTGKSGAYTDIVLDKQHDLPDKCLVGIPFRFAIEMINRGWILRNTIIWHKKNCMPSSVKDRFTVDFEYLFFFSKNKKYYFEQQTEPVKSVSLKRYEYGLKSKWVEGVGEQSIYNTDKMGDSFKTPNKRNKRCVWNISTKPYKGAHFAVFPEELIETPIKAGCPEQICNQCNEARKLVQIKGEYESSGPNKLAIKPRGFAQNKMNIQKLDKDPFGDMPRRKILESYYSDCGCGVGFHPGVVLDPFIGSGTTAAVSKRLNRNYVGIELNPEYHGLIHARLDKTARIKPLSEYGG